MTLEKVDYSPARNSCVAEIMKSYISIGGGMIFERVEDLLSGETLFAMESFDSLENTRDSYPFHELFLPRVWDYVMNNGGEPVDLKKEYMGIVRRLDAPLHPKK